MSTHESRRTGLRIAAPAGLLVLLIGMFSADQPSAIPDPGQTLAPQVLREPNMSRDAERDATPLEGLEVEPAPLASPSEQIPDLPSDSGAAGGPDDGDGAESAPEASAEPELTPDERADRRAGVLEREVPQSGSGELQVVEGASAAPEGADRIIRVRVEVEDGLAVDAQAFADFVLEILNDPRGWGHDDSVAFARTDGDPDIRVVLASPELTDSLCAPLATAGQYSCGREGRAVLNAVRWAQSTEAFLEEAGIQTYREYLVTHEVGHLLGRPHEACPAPGERAPVMQQQSIALDGCTPNGWVAP